jgi:serine/threonine-protein kinase
METLEGVDGLIGADVAGVTLLELRGRGRAGLVFTGFQRALGRKVAVKLAPKGTAAARGFLGEAGVAASLRHPHIVTVFGAGEFCGYMYIAMQLVEGGSLRALIRRKLRHPVPARRFVGLPAAMRAIAHTLDALAYANRAGVVHQDVKPGNILIDGEGGRSYLADFGIARTEPAGKSSRLVSGTPLYMPPEQARGEATDARADVYAAGATLWECLAGALPAPQAPAVKLMGIKARRPEAFFKKTPSESSERIDKDLEAIIQKATAADKGDRYGGCGEFLGAIKGYAERKLGLALQ